jgi:DNA-directed RNA polymerase I, II, and III subunit RPABC2
LVKKDQSNAAKESQDILEMQQTSEDESEEITVDASLERAIDTFKRLSEQDGPLDEKGLADLEKKCEVIRERETIVSDIQHEIKELEMDGKILMGPPILTRFEKARIMGARALQLSLGAPTFIEIPETAATSLDIAMEELEQRLIPISIRRSLPNGDYQNIPLFEFKNE